MNRRTVTIGDLSDNVLRRSAFRSSRLITPITEMPITEMPITEMPITEMPITEIQLRAGMGPEQG